MEVNYKDIWRDNKKYCIICDDVKCDNDIIGYAICDKCLEIIVSLNDIDEEYNNVIRKLNKTITRKILRSNEL